ncbi:MAG: sirohydrochlorin cobaltochelatase [Synergistaceae bacterium]|jgi:sirohydrochlorin cobaltochelatase|nr:sirohydrochlorin cobaltochelatase [Synergistaceae bacterium]
MSSVSFMRVKSLIGALVAMFVLWGALGGSAMAEETGEAKHGILIVAFGSSVPEGQEAISAVENAVKRAWPDTEVRVAFTSRIIMRKIAREQNRVIDEPAVALAKMAYEGFTHVAVLSTHIIPGAEYQDLEAVVDGFRSMHSRGTKAGFTYIGLSLPLLSNANDFERMAKTLTESYSNEGRDGAVIFVGHGTHHFSDAAYSALQMALWRVSPNFFVGTIEGMPSYDDVLAQLRKTRNKKVTLVPAMLVAGDHAQNDIGGGEDDSWRSMLSKEGYGVTPKFQGLGQVGAVQKLLIDKLREAWGDQAL